MRRMISRWRARAVPPVELVLYTRADCHLCEEMKAEIARARAGIPLVLREVDIDEDAELSERFGRSIPVLEIGGRVAFKGRLTVADFERKLGRLARGHAKPVERTGR